MAESGQKTNKTEGDNAQIAFEWLFFELKSDSAINQALIRPSLDIGTTDTPARFRIALASATLNWFCERKRISSTIYSVICVERFNARLCGLTKRSVGASANGHLLSSGRRPAPGVNNACKISKLISFVSIQIFENALHRSESKGQVAFTQ